MIRYAIAFEVEVPDDVGPGVASLINLPVPPGWRILRHEVHGDPSAIFPDES